MSFFSPLALFLGLTIPVIILFYLLKRRRQTQEVPSTLLWKRVLREVEADSPWQRLRRHPLLLLQLLAALALVLGAARPYLHGGQAGHLIVILDSSMSMQATDVSPNRFEAAKERAVAQIGSSKPGTRFSVIAFASRPRILVASAPDPNLARAALNAAVPTFEPGHLEDALELAASVAEGSGLPTSAVVFTDRSAGPDSRGSPLKFTTVRVGTPAENLAISGFTVARLPLEGPDTSSEFWGLVTVSNFGTKARQASVEVLTGDRVAAFRQVLIQPGAAVGVNLPGLPEFGGGFRARLVEEDPLRADNQAFAPSPAGGEIRAALVSEGNVFLERALELFPGLALSRISPDIWAKLDQGEVSDYRMVVFDGYLPDQLPQADLMIWNPPPGNPLIPTGPGFRPGLAEIVDQRDPLVRDVEPSDLRVGSAVSTSLPAWARPVLRTAGGEPLLVAGEYQGRRVAAWSFDLHDSDFPLRPSFPVVISNLLNWYFPETSGEPVQIRPGEPAPLRVIPGATDPRVVTPAGRPMSPDGDGGSFRETGEPGLYRLEQTVAGRKLTWVFAVNAFWAEESRLGGSGVEPSAPTGRAAATEDRPETSGQEYWPYLAWVALAVLTFEWWVFSRGY